MVFLTFNCIAACAATSPDGPQPRMAIFTSLLGKQVYNVAFKIESLRQDSLALFQTF